jgi:hypothetical protein
MKIAFRKNILIVVSDPNLSKVMDVFLQFDTP